MLKLQMKKEIYPATPEIVEAVATGKRYWNEHYTKLSAAEYRLYEQAKKDHFIERKQTRSHAASMYHWWCDATSQPYLYLERDTYYGENIYCVTAEPPCAYTSEAPQKQRFFSPDGAEKFIHFFYGLQNFEGRYTFEFDQVRLHGKRLDLIAVIPEMYTILSSHLMPNIKIEGQRQSIMYRVEERARAIQAKCEQEWIERMYKETIEQGYIIVKTKQDEATHYWYQKWLEHTKQPEITYYVSSHNLRLRLPGNSEKIEHMVSLYLNEHYHFNRPFHHGNDLEYHASIGRRPRGIPEKDRESALKTIANIVRNTL